MPVFLHEFFERSAALRPEQIAVEIPLAPLASGAADRHAASPLTRTYREVLASAHHVRSCLSAFVTGECIIAIMLPKGSPAVHAAQLAVCQAGAAFLCIDQAFPDDHIRFVLADANALKVLTDAATVSRLLAMGVRRDLLLDVEAIGATAAVERLPDPQWLTPRSLAYVVYTSGSTGRPKGVLVEHRSIAHLLEVEQQHLQLQPSDRCAQVSSNAYDSSLEECWLPFTAGATVVVADDEVTRLGPDLVPWLRQQRITVLMPTPTILRATGCAQPAAELPDLRLVYTGGEAITADLVARWAVGLQLENGYGPTECTVTVTRARLHPTQPVTIGQPIGRSRAHVLDQQLEPVRDGHSGELCLSGPCLARGYLERAELTAERFPDHPQLGRIYRTGDLVQLDDRGDLRYLGRIDSQVKVRGYRIELAAIDSQLEALPNVRAAACKAQGEIGRELIVAHVVPVASATALDFAELASALRGILPDFMVPSRFAVIDQLPTSVSGKLDRKSLPDIAAPSGDEANAGRRPRTPLEHLAAERFASALALPSVSIDADFFALGGNSLRAAELITRLRGEPALAELTVRDVYEWRTVAALCGRALLNEASAEAPRTVERELRGRPVLVTVAQSLWLALMLVVGSAGLYVGIYIVLPWFMELLGLGPFLLLAPLLMAAGLAAYTPLALLFAVGVKRVLIGRYRSRRAPVWGSLYLRHWIVQRCVRIVPWGVLQGTEFFLVGLRMLGARIGKRVHVHRGVDLLSGSWDLLTLGDDVTLAQDAIVGLVEYDDGDIVFGSVTMDNGSTLDVRAGMQGGSSLGHKARVAALSNVAPGTHVADHELWDGVPAARVGAAASAPSATANASPRLPPYVYGISLIVARSLLGWLMLLPILAVVVASSLHYEITARAAIDWLWQPATAGLVVASMAVSAAAAVVLRLCMSAMLLRWTRPVAAGCYFVGSRDYLRIWLRTGLLEGAGRWLSGSLYWRWWLRFAGMRLGRNCEISAIIDVLPEQVSIGAETFLADGIYLAGPRLHGGLAMVAPTSLGHDSFVGNHAVVPAGAELPPNILIGVSTVADATKIRAGSSWFGQPPIELPQREIVALDRSLTHDPSMWLFLHRLLWETVRFLLPAMTALIVMAWLQAATLLSPIWLPVVSLAAGLVMAGLVLIAKWLLLGRVRPGTHGLWSPWCCRWDFLYMAWGALAHSVLSPLAGTLLLPWYLRAMGMRIGKRVVLAGSFAQVVDPDMLTVEDGATIDPMFQAHTFEDRALKIGPVRIGKNATVGRATVLFYGTRIEPRCTVAPHSVVMKNETLSAGRHYAGVPTRGVGAVPVPLR